MKKIHIKHFICTIVLSVLAINMSSTSVNAAVVLPPDEPGGIPSYHQYEGPDSVFEDIDQGNLIFLGNDVDKDPNYQGWERSLHSSNIYLHGTLFQSGDNDFFLFRLDDYTFIKAMISASNKNYEIYLGQSFNAEVNRDSYLETQLNEGIYLTPGSYFIGVYDQEGDYSENDEYILSMNVQTNVWTAPETRDIIDMVKNNVKALTWINAFDQEGLRSNVDIDIYPYSARAYDLIHLKHYQQTYLAKRLYVLDKSFSLSLWEMLKAFKTIMQTEAENWKNAESTSDTIIMLCGKLQSALELVSPIPIPKVISAILSYAIEFTINDITDDLLKQQTKAAIENFQDKLDDYFIELDIIGYFMNILRNQDLLAVNALIDSIRETLADINMNMQEDDYYFMDFKKTCDVAYSSQDTLVCNRSIEISWDNLVKGRENVNYNGYFSKIIAENSTSISSIQMNDHGYFSTLVDQDPPDNNLNGNEPTIKLMYDNYNDKIANQAVFNGGVEQDGFMYLENVEENDPQASLKIQQAKDKLLFGAMAYDLQLGFLDVVLIEPIDLSFYDISDSTGVKTATVCAINSNGDCLITGEIYYLVYKMGLVYKKYELRSQNIWTKDSSFVDYSKTEIIRNITSYPGPGFKKVTYQTLEPESYYKYDKYEYYDKICFEIYERSSFFGIPTDSFKKTECYWRDENPSSSNNPDDYDYYTYYLSNLSSSVYIGNSWYVSSLSKTVYMDPRSSVSDGSYYVNNITRTDNDSMKKIGTYVYGWTMTPPIDGTSGDQYFDYYLATTSWTDYLNTTVTSSKRYPTMSDLFREDVISDWYYIGNESFLQTPANNEQYKYVLTNLPPVKMFK